MNTTMTPYLEATIAQIRADFAHKGVALNTIPMSTELEAAIAETRAELAHRPDLAETMAALIALGLVVDSGQRRNGRRVWRASELLRETRP